MVCGPAAQGHRRPETLEALHARMAVASPTWCQLQSPSREHLSLLDGGRLARVDGTAAVPDLAATYPLATLPSQDGCAEDTGPARTTSITVCRITHLTRQDSASSVRLSGLGSSAPRVEWRQTSGLPSVVRGVCGRSCSNAPGWRDQMVWAKFAGGGPGSGMSGTVGGASGGPAPGSYGGAGVSGRCGR